MSGPLAGETILVLEDELIIGFALEDMLAGLGARVVLAATLAEAQARLSDTAFSLAVLDVNIGGEKSYPVAEALAARGVPLLFATGYGDTAHPPHLVATPTLTKPYNRRQLADALLALRGQRR